jgi:hypothetical protein
VLSLLRGDVISGRSDSGATVNALTGVIVAVASRVYDP